MAQCCTEGGTGLLEGAGIWPHSLVVVDRVSETQLQVGENWSHNVEVMYYEDWGPSEPHLNEPCMGLQVLGDTFHWINIVCNANQRLVCGMVDSVSGDFGPRLFWTGDFGRLSVILDGDFGRCAVKSDGDFGRCAVNSDA